MGLTAQQLEAAILEEAKGGPTTPSDLYPEGDEDLDTFIERYEKENPGVYVQRSDTGLYVNLPVRPCPEWSVLYIAVDELSRCYGGPEEGGWWYDSGDVVEREPIRVSFADEGPQAPKLSDEERRVLGQIAEKWADQYDFGTSYRSSMRPRGRDFSWRVTWEIPQDWPRYKPHYE